MPEDADELDRGPDDGPALEVDQPPADRHVVLDQANPLHAVADRRVDEGGTAALRRHDDLGGVVQGGLGVGRGKPERAVRAGACQQDGGARLCLEGTEAWRSSGTRRPPRRACRRGRGPEPSRRIRPLHPPSARIPGRLAARVGRPRRRRRRGGRSGRRAPGRPAPSRRGRRGPSASGRSAPRGNRGRAA